MRTISFPVVGAFAKGVTSTRERSLYMDGLAVLQEAAATREVLGPVIWDSVREILQAAMELPHLGPHLIQSAQRVTEAAVEQRAPKDGNINLAPVVELHYLRESMEDRLIDIAVEVSRMSTQKVTFIENQYDEAALEARALWRDTSRMRGCDFPDQAIRRTLGLEAVPETELKTVRPGGERRGRPIYPGSNVTVYKHVNSMGTLYYLNRADITLHDGRSDDFFFFAKVCDPLTATELPADRVVKEDPHNGFLAVFKKK